MANIQNLKPSEYKLSVEEAKKGGINSGKARREKATMKKTLEMMLEEVADIDNNDKGLTYKQLATIGLLKGAILGNSANYKTILETIGEILENNNNETPSVQINIVDNNDLEKVLYEDNHKS